MTQFGNDKCNDELVTSNDKLVRSAIDGDAEALAQLLRAHQASLSIRVSRYLQVNAFADFGVEDVLQEVFLDAFRGIHDFRQENAAAFTVWINRITDRRLISMLRYRKRPKRFSADVPVFTPKRREDDSDRIPLIMGVDVPDRKSSSPSSVAHQADIARVLRAELARLPGEQQQVLRWIFLEKRSLMAAARRMRMSPRAIQTLVQRAKRSLRAALGGPGRWFS